MEFCCVQNTMANWWGKNTWGKKIYKGSPRQLLLVCFKFHWEPSILCHHISWSHWWFGLCCTKEVRSCLANIQLLLSASWCIWKKEKKMEKKNWAPKIQWNFDVSLTTHKNNFGISVFFYFLLEVPWSLYTKLFG